MGVSWQFQENYGSGKSIFLVPEAQFVNFDPKIGAVASIAQVAQLGVQLSLTLYNIAQGIGTASKVCTPTFIIINLQEINLTAPAGSTVNRQGHLTLLSGTQRLGNCPGQWTSISAISR